VGTKVVLLEFSRNPKSYRTKLMECDELRECRDSLVAQGFTSELPSLAKVFVPPEMFEATMEAIRRAKIKLQARHLLVAPELEDTVKRLLQTPMNPEEIRPKKRSVLPLGFAGASVQADLEIFASRTFIDIKRGAFESAMGRRRSAALQFAVCPGTLVGPT